MIPVAFDGMLGKYHPPEGEPSGLGVVIVPPHGIEALPAVKSLRLLAETLASAGHACLRFDLPGTGDSLGDDADPDRFGAWTAGIGAAAATLAQLSGARGIVLAGLRLGALLAAAASPAVEALAGLVLMDPVVKGRAHARELAVMARTVAESSRLDPQATVTAEGIHVGGMLTSTATLERLKTVDLAALAPPPAPVLVLRRKGAADAAGLCRAWAAAGAAVTEREAAGFEGLELGPTFALTPHEAFAAVADWLAALPRRAPGPSRTPAPAVLQGEGFREEALVFGGERHLFGILCEPEGAPGAPALVILNAGRNAHVGWARSGVRLARFLARNGVASLRFDIAGIGDTPDRPRARDHVDAVLYNPDTEPDAAAAIALIAARGHRAISLMGACSGAYLAFRRAAEDPQIGGVVMVNPQRFVWRGGETVEEAIASSYALASSYVAKLWEPRAWRRVLSGERALLPLAVELAKRVFARLRAVVPSRETRAARALMQRLTGRGIPVSLVYSENDAGIDELSRHFGGRGRRLSRFSDLSLAFVPAADHDMTPRAAQDRLFAEVLAVAKAGRAPAGPPPGPGAGGTAPA